MRLYWYNRMAFILRLFIFILILLISFVFIWYGL
jgi:hypothetical protein